MVAAGHCRSLASVLWMAPPKPLTALANTRPGWRKWVSRGLALRFCHLDNKTANSVPSSTGQSDAQSASRVSVDARGVPDAKG